MALSFANEVSQLLGCLALAGFACAMVMSTRAGLLDCLFHGLDKMYVVHKQVGVTSVVLVVAHLLTRIPSRTPVSQNPLGHIGVLSFVLFVVLILLALGAKRLGYEAWKWVHKLMVVPYGVGLLHYFGSSAYDPLGVTPLSLWMDLCAVIGLGAAVYAIGVYEWAAFRRRYRVTGVELVAGRTLQITGQAVARPLAARPGQFAFIKTVRTAGHRFPSHPFTISRIGGDEIEFTIKALGDHTSSLVEGHIHVGDTLAVSRAYGRFDYTQGGEHQVWIAAGIGITPFRAFLAAGVPAAYSIDLFYSFKGEPDAPYLDDIQALAPPNVRVHPNDTQTGGRLTADQIAQVIDPGNPPHVFFCGPRPMRDHLRAALRAKGITRFHAEEFQFRPAGKWG
jgi:predicted ferric reductase